MIARRWHGIVPTEKAQTYREFLIARAIPDYQSVPGNLGVFIFLRADGDVTHFETLTFWDNRDSIRRFAGDDIERAKYYPEDKNFLIEFEPTVQHFEVIDGSNIIK